MSLSLYRHSKTPGEGYLVRVAQPAQTRPAAALAITRIHYTWPRALSALSTLLSTAKYLTA